MTLIRPSVTRATLIALFSGVLVASTLAGCGKAGLTRDDYLEFVRESETFTSGTSDETLDEFAVAVCDIMRGGDEDTSWLLGVQALTDEGMTGGEAGAFLSYAAGYRCPDMLDRFPET